MTIIENLSKRKLVIVVTLLSLCLVPCFLIGGLIAPMPTDTHNIIGTVFNENEDNSTDWLNSRGECDIINGTSENYGLLTGKVFVFKMPPALSEEKQSGYFRWQQILKGVLQVQVQHLTETERHERHLNLTIDARLSYRNTKDPEGAWKLIAESVQKRNFICKACENNLCNCSTMPLFKVSSLYHDFYLLNIHLQDEVNFSNSSVKPCVKCLKLTVINQNEQFTKVWISMKTVLLPVSIALVIWYYRRVFKLQRKLALLERMIFSLVIGISLINMPLEFLTLQFDLPLLLFFADVRLAVFYIKLFCFWIVFIGEHMIIRDDSAGSTFKRYWLQLTAILVVCLFLFIFDVFERGLQFQSPFYTLWFEDLGVNIKFLLLGLFVGIYFLWLCYITWKVFINVSRKRPFLPGISEFRRSHYESTIYRFKFLAIATLLCAVMTIICFVLGQNVAEGQLKWDEYVKLEYASAFFTGVYGMWNLYVFAITIFYSPSHKQWSEKENKVRQSINRISDIPIHPN